MWNAGSWCSNQWTTAMYECLQDTKVTLVSFEKPLWRNVTVRLWERIVRWVYKRQKQIYSPGHFSLRVDRKALLSIHNAALWSSGPDADSVYRYVWFMKYKRKVFSGGITNLILSDWHVSLSIWAVGCQNFSYLDELTVAEIFRHNCKKWAAISESRGLMDQLKSLVTTTSQTPLTNH